MKLDVVVPTYNRSALLERTIASLLRANVPSTLGITLLIVDNNSRDDTAAVIARLQSGASLPIRYVRQTLQGLSHSRNAGIEHGAGEIIGFIDDDEEIDAHWFEVVAREFENPATDFIGGPYLPNCEHPMPSWLPPGYNGVIGVVPPKTHGPYSPTFPGNLQGGNAVIRRRVFDRVGLFDTNLGRNDKGLLSEEDAELYRRMLAAGFHGIHAPDLIIYHHIPASRLTRRYHRSWCYGRGISQGVADRTHPEPVSYLFGVPRYRIRRALAGLVSIPRNLSPHSGSGISFARELSLWDLAGFLKGKFLTR